MFSFVATHANTVEVSRSQDARRGTSFRGPAKTWMRGLEGSEGCWEMSLDLDRT